MAFCPVCNPGMTEDDDGERYVPGPMVIDKETGEEVEDEDEREYLQDDGDICAKHTVYVSGNLDEGGQWGDCDLDSFLEKVREAFEANPESPTLAKALQAVPDWLSEPALDYAQREEGDDEPHEELYLSLIEHAEQETFGESYSWAGMVCDNTESCYLIYAENPGALFQEIAAQLAPGLAAFG